MNCQNKSPPTRGPYFSIFTRSVLKLLPRLYWQTWPSDNDGNPLSGNGTELSHWMGDFLNLEWFGFGLTVFGHNYRRRPR